MRRPFLIILITYSISILGLTFIEGTDENGNSYHMTIFDAFILSLIQQQQLDLVKHLMLLVILKECGLVFLYI